MRLLCEKSDFRNKANVNGWILGACKPSRVFNIGQSNTSGKMLQWRIEFITSFFKQHCMITVDWKRSLDCEHCQKRWNWTHNFSGGNEWQLACNGEINCDMSKLYPMSSWLTLICSSPCCCRWERRGLNFTFESLATQYRWCNTGANRPGEIHASGHLAIVSSSFNFF